MNRFKTLEFGKIALIQQNEDGRILQIGLTSSQSEMLQLFLAKLSEDSKLVQMPKEYDLILKSGMVQEKESSIELLKCLKKLVDLKDWKDNAGKDEGYLRAQPIAWKRAKAAIKKAAVLHSI